MEGRDSSIAARDLPCTALAEPAPTSKNSCSAAEGTHSTWGALYRWQGTSIGGAQRHAHKEAHVRGPEVLKGELANTRFGAGENEDHGNEDEDSRVPRTISKSLKRELA